MSRCVRYVCLVPTEVKKRESDHLKLESGMVVSHHGGAGNPAQVFGKNNKCSKLLSHLSSPIT